MINKSETLQKLTWLRSMLLDLSESVDAKYIGHHYTPVHYGDDKRIIRSMQTLLQELQNEVTGELE